MSSSWIIAIEQEGKYLFASKYVGSCAYILALFKAARLVDERLPKASLKVGSLETRGVIGCITEWKREERYWTVEPSIVKDLAKTTRYVDLNYE
jgi:hypothetical protein